MKVSNWEQSALRDKTQISATVVRSTEFLESPKSTFLLSMKNDDAHLLRVTVEEPERNYGSFVTYPTQRGDRLSQSAHSP